MFGQKVESLMEFWKDLTTIIQAIFTSIQAILISIGIVVGGFWTYLMFVRERLGFPKVNIDLNIEDIDHPPNKRIVHVEIQLKNIGRVILKSDYSELRIRKVVPIPEEISSLVEKGDDPVAEGRTEIEWPLIVKQREWQKDKDFEIEPGETDFLHADYVINSEIKVVEFYFYLANAKKKKKKQNIGWTQTKIHKFNTEGDVK